MSSGFHSKHSYARGSQSSGWARHGGRGWRHGGAEGDYFSHGTEYTNYTYYVNISEADWNNVSGVTNVVDSGDQSQSGVNNGGSLKNQKGSEDIANQWLLQRLVPIRSLS